MWKYKKRGKIYELNFDNYVEAFKKDSEILHYSRI